VRIERVFHKARNFKEAEEWDVSQYLQMTPEQRQAVASALKIRFFGAHAPDVREAHGKNES
jgi:hypothetical protein